MSAWETIEHHNTLKADKEGYPAIRASFLKVAKEVVFTNHVQFSGDFTKALGAPVTELAIWTLKEGTDRTEFQAGLKALLEVIDSAVPPEVHVAGLGAVVEDERKFIAGLGWPSVEVR